jgi:AraC-like DNA-binding protein
VMRLQQALRMLKHGHSASQTALACGFSDQAHMSREVRRMTGFPPSRLLPAYGSGQSDPLTDNRVSGRVTTFQVPGEEARASEGAHSDESDLRAAG